MLILGIDPWTTTVWYALLEKEGSVIRIVQYGTIETRPRESLEYKLLDIARDLTEILDTYTPVVCGIERLFFFKNITNGIDVAHARGVILHTLVSHGVQIREFTPLEVKKGITGDGLAKKRQMQNALKLLFKLSDFPKPDDAADALAIAYLTALHCR